MIKKAVCLISGGLDSCITAHLAKNEGYDIYSISFNYCQRHDKEIESARQISTSVNAKNHIVFDIDLSKFGVSSLVDKTLGPEKDRNLDEIGKKIPSTYVPARNTIFLSIALAYAEVVNAEAIFIGATATDFSGYPDCRPEFITAFQKLTNVATKRCVEGNIIKIQAPLLHLSKAEIIKKGMELKAPLEKTWSCYMGGKKACGRCDSCILRLKGFKEAEAIDPLDYDYFPEWYIKK